MAASGRVHDRAILDALESIAPEPFVGDAWRVTRKGRDALRGSGAGGRWGPAGEFEVLNTSLEREGALAEVGFRLSLEPVWPSRMEHQLHEISLKMERSLPLTKRDLLANLGVDLARYESLDYRATQAIAAAARFLEFDFLLVPSARHPCTNLIIFMDRVTGRNCTIDWRSNKPMPSIGVRGARQGQRESRRRRGRICRSLPPSALCRGSSDRARGRQNGDACPSFHLRRAHPHIWRFNSRSLCRQRNVWPPMIRDAGCGPMPWR